MVSAAGKHNGRIGRKTRRTRRPRLSARDRAAEAEETFGDPAKGKHLKGPSLNRECTRLGDPFSASLQDRSKTVTFYSAAITRGPIGSGIAEKTSSGS
jgi:hypothetical protein